MNKSPTIETFFVLAFLAIGCWTVHLFFLSGCNPNDFRAVGKPDITVPSYNVMVIEGKLVNASPVAVKHIDMTADAYDASGRIVGTGRFSPGPGAVAIPSDTLSYKVNISCTEGYKAVKNVMLIPHCNLGTGRLTFALW